MNEKVCTYCGMAGHRASQCPRRPRERDIKAHMLRRVAELGGRARKVTWEGRTGAPDWRVMLPHKRFWLELKAPGEKPTPRQIREHNAMRRMGEVVHVVDSIEGVEELLA